MRSILHEEGSFLHFRHIFICITPLVVFTFYSHSKTNKKISFTNSYILGICSWMAFLLISAKNWETFILTWILLFCFPIKLVLQTKVPFHGAHHIFFFLPNSVSLVGGLSEFHVYLHHNKEKNIRAGVCQYLTEQVANDMDYLNNVITANEMWIYYYNSVCIQATDEQMGSMRFFLHTKNMCCKIKNEMPGYHILWPGRLGIHIHCARWSVNTDW